METVSEVLIAGLIRLLRLQEIAARATEGGTSSRTSSDYSIRSRWLVERAIAHLIRYGENRAWTRLHDDLSKDTANDSSGSEIARIRTSAIDFLLRLDKESISPFFELLTVAVRDQIIVVMVKPNLLQGYYSFRAPLIPAKQHREINEYRETSLVSRFRRSVSRYRQRIPTYGEFRVEYDSLIPRNLNSYHVAFEVPEEINVRRFVLTTDADQVSTRSIINNLRSLASATDLGSYGDARAALYILELEDVLARVAHLGRRRRTNLVNYIAYVQELYGQFGYVLPPKARSWLEHAVFVNPEQVIEEVKESRCNITILSSLALLHEQGKLIESLKSKPDNQIHAFLGQLAQYLETADIGWDVTVDNDPRENGAHAYWRNIRTDLGPKSNQPVRARVQLALADEPPALISSVSWMLLGIVALVGYLTFKYSAEAEFVGNQPDAIVAVLLLVPGALLTRLNIPSTHSVLGVIRVFPRIIAYSSVIITTALALGVATNPKFLGILFDVAWSLLILLLMLSFLVTLIRRRSRRALVAATTATPRWLATEMHALRRKEAPPPNAAFEPVGLFTGITQGAAIESADVASLAAREATERDAGIAYEITHMTAAEAARRRGAKRDARTLEMLETSAFGITIKTSVANRSDKPRFDEAGGFIVSDRNITRYEEGSTASGAVVLSLRPLARSVRRVEYLIVVGSNLETKNAIGRRLTCLLTILIRAAEASGAVLTYAIAPAAPPTEAPDGVIEATQSSPGTCLRLELSAADALTSQRLDFAGRLAELAHSHGFGLYANEGRSGSGMEYWRELKPPGEKKPSQMLSKQRPSPTPEVQDENVVAVSVVGPSRREAQAELRQIAELLDYHKIGCIALVASQIQQVICVHMLLTSSCAELEQAGVPWPDLHSNQEMREDGLPRWPANFVPILGTDLVTATDWARFGQKVVPFWVSWNVPATSFTAEEIVQILIAKFGGSLTAASFIRSRVTSSQRLQGSGKISVELRSEWKHSDAQGRYANSVQNAVLQELLTVSGLDARDVIIRIARGQRWLESSL
jgi:hypothetical protein